MIKASVIIPIYNEEHFISKCLESVCQTTFNKDHMEIIAIDGNSTDNTLNILKNFDSRGISFAIINNPEKIVSAALNKAISKARGQYIIRMDAHTTYHPNYITKCIALLDKKIAQNVGGPMRLVCKSPLDHAIAIATGCRFGIGNSSFHFEEFEGYVDSVYLGAFDRLIFSEIGLFDEELIRNQDDELNYRIITRGKKIYQSPEIISHYSPRSAFSKLWKQYFQYGFWKIKVMKKHGTIPSIRHIIPGLFSAYLVFSLIFIKFQTFQIMLSIILGLYFAIAIFYSVKNIFKRPLLSLIILPVTFAIIHLAYGFGSIAGIYSFLIKEND